MRNPTGKFCALIPEHMRERLYKAKLIEDKSMPYKEP